MLNKNAENIQKYRRHKIYTKCKRLVKTRRMLKTWHIQNIMRMVKTWRMLKTWRLGKYQSPWKCWRWRSALLFRLGRICNCWLLPGHADEHVLLLVDVEPQTCSLQVRNGFPVPCFYGQTLLPYCTGCLYRPSMLKMVKSLAHNKYLAPAWNFTVFS